MTRIQPAIDLSALPTVVFGKVPFWWSMAFAMTAEGSSLAASAGAYLYLRKNAGAWPPEHTPLPDVLVPALGLLVMLASLFPYLKAAGAAMRFDLRAVRLWLVVSSLVTAALWVIRWFEFGALNVRWDSNAYGSAAWAVLIIHTMLLLVQLPWVVGLAALMWNRKRMEMHYVMVSHSTMYWKFVVGTWAPLYLVAFISPFVL